MDPKKLKAYIKHGNDNPGGPPEPDDDEGGDVGGGGGDDDVRQQLGGKIGALKAALVALDAGNTEDAINILKDLRGRIDKAINDLGGDGGGEDEGDGGGQDEDEGGFPGGEG